MPRSKEFYRRRLQSTNTRLLFDEGYNESYDPENVTAMPQSVFWREPVVDKASDVMVATKQLKNFKLDLKKLDLKFTILVRSVHNLILKQGGINRKAPKHLAQHSQHNMTWDSYR